MTERAAGIGGTLDLENSPDGGALVRLAAPFRPIVEPPGAPPPEPVPAPQPMLASTPGVAFEPTLEPRSGMADEPTPGAAPITA
jgi:hypothetical protein